MNDHRQVDKQYQLLTYIRPAVQLAEGAAGFTFALCIGYCELKHICARPRHARVCGHATSNENAAQIACTTHGAQGVGGMCLLHCQGKLADRNGCAIRVCIES